MPLDVLGRTRATLLRSASIQPRPEGLGNLSKSQRDGARILQLLFLNEEFLVDACHQRASITSLPFVHTARRSYRLNDPAKSRDRGRRMVTCADFENLLKPYHLEEGEVVTRFP